MNRRPGRFSRWVGRFADRGYYVAIVAVLAGVDMFILIVPTEPLMVSAVLLSPFRWARTALTVAVGSSLGATALSWVAAHQGPALMTRMFPNSAQSPDWARASHLVQEHGAWGIAVIAASPLPPHPFIALAGLSLIPVPIIGISVFAGRIAKYLLINWVAQKGVGIVKSAKDH